jgi:hypothetical protein
LGIVNLLDIYGESFWGWEFSGGWDDIDVVD